MIYLSLSNNARALLPAARVARAASAASDRIGADRKGLRCSALPQAYSTLCLKLYALYSIVCTPCSVIYTLYVFLYPLSSVLSILLCSPPPLLR